MSRWNGVIRLFRRRVAGVKGREWRLGVMEPRLRGRVLRTVALAALLSVAPACSATAGNKWGSGQPSGSIVRRVFRPILEPQVTKQFFPSGYAGATYGPGPGMRVYPSMYRRATGQAHCAGCQNPSHSH